jgi:hypothetical protein
MKLTSKYRRRLLDSQLLTSEQGRGVSAFSVVQTRPQAVIRQFRERFVV